MSSVGMSLELDHLNVFACKAGTAIMAATVAAAKSGSLSFMKPSWNLKRADYATAAPEASKGVSRRSSVPHATHGWASTRRAGEHRTEPERAIPGAGGGAGIVAVAHDAYAHQRAGLFTECPLEVGADVAVVIQPLVELACAGLDHQFAHAVGARALDHGARFALVAPHVHERGVRHFLTRERERQLR